MSCRTAPWCMARPLSNPAEAEWRTQLDPQRYRVLPFYCWAACAACAACAAWPEVLRQQGTEPPGSHQYDRFMPAKATETKS